MQKLLKIKFLTFFPQYTNGKHCLYSGCYAVAPPLNSYAHNNKSCNHAKIKNVPTFCEMLFRK